MNFVQIASNVILNSTLSAKSEAQLPKMTAIFNNIILFSREKFLRTNILDPILCQLRSHNGASIKYVRTEGGGVQKSKNFADLRNGSHHLSEITLMSQAMPSEIKGPYLVGGPYRGILCHFEMREFS